MRIHITSNAVADIESIYAFLVARNADAASRLIDRIHRRISFLVDMPRLGLREQRAGRQARKLIVGRHLIIYRVKAEAVVILRVVDDRRDVALVFKSRDA